MKDLPLPQGTQMEDRLDIHSSARTYHVHVGAGLLQRTGTLVRELPFGKERTKCAVITDECVGALYADNVLSSLSAAGFAPVCVTIAAGEASKSMETVAQVANRLTEARLDRHDFIVALGGGVVGDLAGFVASIYFRGIPYVQIPTTIVSQVDSAIGGKTGVNLPAGKNLLGTFYPPFLVIADVSTLATLPDREFNEGFAEVIKHGVIRDAGLLRRVAAFRQDDANALTWIIRRNLEIKAEIVAADEFERLGVRALLNFGHTIGHAIEQAAGYGHFLHGEAISLGMIAAGRLSMAKASFPETDFEEMAALLRQFRLPTELPAGFPTQSILEGLAQDKKFESGDVRFVLTPRLGSAFLTERGLISWENLRQAVEGLLPSSNN